MQHAKLPRTADEVRRLRDLCGSDKAVADYYAAHHGITVTESAVSANRRRLGVEAAHPRASRHGGQRGAYKEYFPFGPIKSEHYPHRLRKFLTRYARWRTGGELSEAEFELLHLEIAYMDDAVTADGKPVGRVVVAYDRERGFRLVPRRADDVGYVRRPQAGP